MATRTRNGRVQIDRAGITNLTGASTSTIAHWQRHRDQTSFPHKADTDTTGRDWFWQNDIRDFWHNHQQRRTRSYTDVDRRGHPDDLLTAPEAAKVLGYKDHRSLTPALRENPDHVERLPSGLLRRYWYRRTIWTYADTRHQRTSTGHPTGPTGPRKPRPYADDPRLPVAVALLAEAETAGRGTQGLGAVLAERLNIGVRTAQRLLAAATTVHQTAPRRESRTRNLTGPDSTNLTLRGRRCHQRAVNMNPTKLLGNGPPRTGCGMWEVLPPGGAEHHQGERGTGGV